MLESVKGLPSGDYAECGVWKGYMAQKIYREAVGQVWLFDSFEGHGEPGEFDDKEHHPKGRYNDTSIWSISRKFPNAQVVPGWVQETLDLVADKKFRFVNIDVDHYEPTKAACEFFKSRMVKGGVIRFDDYGFAECPGATKAVDEVFGKENILPNDYRWISS